MSNQQKTKIQKRIIGKQKYINSETNEIEEHNITEEVGLMDYNFYKIWIPELAKLLKLIGGSKGKVIAEILTKMDSKNIYIGSVKKISENAKVSEETARIAVKVLKDENFLVMQQEAVYRVNPDFIAKGGSKKRGNLLREYNDIEIDKKVRRPISEESKTTLHSDEYKFVKAEKKIQEEELINLKEELFFNELREKLNKAS